MSKQVNHAMTSATQSFLFSDKNDFAQKESEISNYKAKKLKFLLKKTKESEEFEAEFFARENIENPQLRATRSWKLIFDFANSFIEQAKTSNI